MPDVTVCLASLLVFCQRARQFSSRARPKAMPGQLLRVPVLLPRGKNFKQFLLEESCSEEAQKNVARRVHALMALSGYMSGDFWIQYVDPKRPEADGVAFEFDCLVSQRFSTGKVHKDGEWYLKVLIHPSCPPAEEIELILSCDNQQQKTESQRFNCPGNGGFGAAVIVRGIDGKHAVKLSTGFRNDILVRERDILKRLQGCPHVINFIEEVTASVATRTGLLQIPGFCMELCQMSLEHWVKRTKHTNWADAMYFLLSDVAQGLDAMHSMDVVHMDIKPANLLVVGKPLWCKEDTEDLPVNHRMNIRIADFGSAGELGSKVNPCSKAIANAALLFYSYLSDMVREPKYDYFGLGITMFETVRMDFHIPWLSNWRKCIHAEKFARYTPYIFRPGLCAINELVRNACKSEVCVDGNLQNRGTTEPPMLRTANHEITFWRCSMDDHHRDSLLGIPLRDSFVSDKPLAMNAYTFFHAHFFSWATGLEEDQACLRLRPELLATAALLTLIQKAEQEVRVSALNSEHAKHKSVLQEDGLDLGTLPNEKEHLAVWVLFQLRGLFLPDEGDWDQSARFDSELDNLLRMAFVELTGCTTLLVSARISLANLSLDVECGKHLAVVTSTQVLQRWTEVRDQLSYEFPACVMTSFVRKDFETFARFLLPDSKSVLQSWRAGAKAVRTVLQQNRAALPICQNKEAWLQAAAFVIEKARWQAAPSDYSIEQTHKVELSAVPKSKEVLRCWLAGKANQSGKCSTGNPKSGPPVALISSSNTVATFQLMTRMFPPLGMTTLGDVMHYFSKMQGMAFRDYVSDRDFFEELNEFFPSKGFRVFCFHTGTESNPVISVGERMSSKEVDIAHIIVQVPKGLLFGVREFCLCVAPLDQTWAVSMPGTFGHKTYWQSGGNFANDGVLHFKPAPA